jgi:hypothetical protein
MNFPSGHFHCLILSGDAEANMYLEKERKKLAFENIMYHQPFPNVGEVRIRMYIPVSKINCNTFL